MTEEAKPINITIFDKEYLVTCKDDEREQLHTAVAFLNDKLLELKRGGKVIGAERIAMITALNLTHELLAYKREKTFYNESIDESIRRLNNKIDTVLEKGKAVQT
ncbi:MAG: hypothetical protein A3I78_10080 [Gammaproteobacteria bacterium RIFCSPLOWO2_02_FULL_56_15]|nr:MAG: hypothetical protein A3I78_10080 [Gammaproteobacteria bacterium RIFCSPLOWO2_02_FULL_56_15]